MVVPDRNHRRHFLLVGAVAALLLAIAACSPPVSIQELKTRPSGTYAQVLTFRATALEPGPEHVLNVSIDVDPAKLMGWAKTNRAYTTGLAAKLVGPEGTEAKHATLYLPITEQREVGREGNVTQVAYLAAGAPMKNGFRRGAAREAFRFSPAPGQWALTIEMRTVNNADRMMIKAIRTLHLDVLGPKDGDGALSGWTLDAP